MKRITTLTRSTAIAGVAALLAMPAQAMTCADFNQMEEDAQKAALMGIEAGRAEAREMARSDAMEDAEEGVLVTEDDDMDGGREEKRERARGVDDAIFMQAVDDCKNDPDMDVTSAMPPAAADKY
ncbi:hypothetical protein [Roseovarius salis]|uniref:hypothetical protein n=1 Tax=Roseovarius salis TaxID=3376063 RepID=UPI0037C5BE1B